MKKRITEEQWNELTEEGKAELGEPSAVFDLDTGWHKMYPSIGQMIEFLDDEYINALYFRDGPAVHKKIRAVGVCDALWKAVKEVLNE